MCEMRLLHTAKKQHTLDNGNSTLREVGKKRNQCQKHKIGIHSETKRKLMSLTLWTDDRFAMTVFFPLGDYVSQEVTST